MCVITFGNIHFLKVRFAQMFRLNCCGGRRKARVFNLRPEKHFKEVLLKTAVCTKCKKFVVVLEKTDFNGKVKRIKKMGVDAVIFYENQKHNIMFEVIRVKASGAKVAWTYYKTVNATTQVRRYMDESGNAGAKVNCPLRVIA